MQVTIDLPENTAKTYRSLPQEKKKEIAHDLSTMIESKREQIGRISRKNQKHPMLEFLEYIEKSPALDLPEDASINHDHYLYGTPKRT